MKNLLTDEERKRLIALARKNKWQPKEIAEAIGTTTDNVSRIVERDSRNSRYVEDLDNWLRNFAAMTPNDARKHLVLRESSGRYASSESGTLRRTGEALIRLGEELIDPEPTTAFKLLQYETFIKAAHAHLDVFRAEVQKGRE